MLDALLRIERRQVIEQDLVAGLIGRFEVDRLDLDQGKIFFPFVRRPHLAADRVTGFQVELADLGGRNVDIIRAGQVVVVRRTQKAVAIGQDFQHALGKDVAFFFTLRLQNFEDQVLFAHTAGAG